jgi:branched-chain amino acid transport system substrate-binding protein
VSRIMKTVRWLPGFVALLTLVAACAPAAAPPPPTAPAAPAAPGATSAPAAGASPAAAQPAASPAAAAQASPAAKPAAASPGKPIKVGFAGGISGDAAKVGQDVQTAVQLAVEQANAKGDTLPGQKLELVTLDDKNDPREGVSVANRLVADADVVAVVGHVFSGISVAAQPVYRDAKMAMITAVSTSPKVTEQGSNNVFRTVGRDEQQVVIATEAIAKKWPNPKIAILHDKQTFGQGIAELARDSFGKKGWAIDTFEGITAGEKDFTPLLTKIKAQNPDILYWGGLSTEGGLIAKQMKQLGLNAQFFSNDGIWDTTFIEIAGPAAEGALMTIGPSLEDLPSAKDFAEAYKKRFNAEPTGYAVYGYDATNVIVDAIKRAGKADRDAVRAAVASTKGFAGASGPVSFDQKGDRVERYYVLSTVKSGKFATVKE